MKGRTNPRKVMRLRRKRRTTFTIRGTAERPRLNVFRSNRHIYTQVIDDQEGKTLLAVSTQTPDLLNGEEKGLTERGNKVGLKMAELCKEKGITALVFDRNGFIYRKGGRIDAVAAGLRKGGINV